MRIWSLHPKYLDAKGLVALWRETLLAKHVLEGKTKGYTNHPQLDRFKAQKDPPKFINQYLADVFEEAASRGYQFDRKKFRKPARRPKMNVTSGQMEFEVKHLKRKLKMRDRKKLAEVAKVKIFDPHPLFRIVRGEMEEWEIV
ncbi:MAG TPA: pyrimidine dimer DNA glycosylase/endonuclease V [Bacteroidia bacterium]|nr:pyrimidine dimer DNA glycosylase/endonuclease V [Bacteroidia bacterium]